MDVFDLNLFPEGLLECDWCDEFFEGKEYPEEADFKYIETMPNGQKIERKFCSVSCLNKFAEMVKTANESSKKADLN